MNKLNVTKMFNTAKSFMTKHSPEILTGVGIAGMITTTILAVKATPKAMELIQEAERAKYVKHTSDYHSISREPLTKLETVKVAWKPYIPAAITCVLSTTCLIGASATNYKRNAALATAYQVAATTLADYKEQVVESIGEKKEKTIREKAAQKTMDRNPELTQHVIVTGNGTTLFVDPISMRSFEYDLEKLRSVVNDLNERMTCGMEEYISLSELYDELGLVRTDTSDDIGWNLGRDGQIKVSWYPCTDPNTNRPAFMLEFQVSPRYGFEKLI